MASWWLPGERGVDEVAGVRVSRVDRQLGAVLDRPADLVDVGEVDLRVDALAEEVHAEGDQADVAGALAVAEEAALDAIGAGHHGQLGRRDRGAPVVVGVQADRGVLPPGELAGEPLDLVGVDVRRGHLDGGRQVQDDLAPVVGLPHVRDRLAHLDRERQLGPGEDLRAVLVADDGAVEVVLGVLHDQLGAADRDVLDLVAAGVEDHSPEQRRQGVVEVDVGVVHADQGLHGALDQVLARLGEHRDRHVLGDPVLLDQLADEAEVGLAGRREADLDLLVAHPHQEVEHRVLAGRRHRVDQRLVAVAQVRAQPARRLGHRPGRPGPVGQLDRREGAVAVDRHAAGPLGVAEWSGGGCHGFLAGFASECRCARPPQRGARLCSDLAAAAKKQVRHDGPTITHRFPERGAAGPDRETAATLACARTTRVRSGS